MEANQAAGSLWVNGRPVPLSSSRMTIGRAPENEVVLDDARVSRHHAAIEPDGTGGLRVTDLGSGNGTYVGSRLLRGESSVIRDGDEVRLGNTVIGVSLPSDGGNQATVLRTGAPASQEQARPTPEPEPEPERRAEADERPQPSRLMQILRTTRSAVCRQLQRCTRRSLVVAIVAVLVAVGVGAAAAAGVF